MPLSAKSCTRAPRLWSFVSVWSSFLVAPSIDVGTPVAGFLVLV